MGGLAGLGGWLQDTLQQSFRADGDLKAGKRPQNTFPILAPTLTI